MRGRAWACVGVRGRAWACVGVRGRAWACVGVRGRAWAGWQIEDPKTKNFTKYLLKRPPLTFSRGH